MTKRGVCRNCSGLRKNHFPNVPFAAALRCPKGYSPTGSTKKATVGKPVKFNPDCPSCRADERRRKRLSSVKAPAAVLPPFIMTEWIVSRSLSKKHDLTRGGAGLVYHVQARTADQFSSVATLVGENAPLTRQKGADGVTDIFTCMSDQGHTTMNIVGKIRYEGDWPK